MKIIARLAAAVFAVGSVGIAQAGTIGITGPGAAAGTVTATPATGAPAPFMLGNFGSSTTNGLVSTAPIYYRAGLITFSPDASSPQAGVYAGNVLYIAASPYAGTGLASSTMEYLAAQPGDNVTLTYTNARATINLLWGSIDTFNTLDLETITGGIVVNDLQVTGAEVLAAAAGTANGSAFVTITDATTFNTAIFKSTQSAFEFVPDVNVPEPVSIALLGTGLLALGGIVNRRTKKA